MDCRRVQLCLETSVQLLLLLVWYRILPVRFRKKICRSERALLPVHLDAIRLSMLPMAIGLNPPSIFMRAISFAPKKKGLRGSGVLPSPMRFISLVSDFRKFKSCTAIRLTNKIFKNLRNYFIRTCC